MCAVGSRCRLANGWNKSLPSTALLVIALLSYVGRICSAENGKFQFIFLDAD